MAIRCAFLRDAPDDYDNGKRFKGGNFKAGNKGKT
jgi:hypothetical protein